MNIGILHSGDLKSVSPGGVSQYIEKLIIENEDNSITVFGTKEINDSYELFKEYEQYIEDKKYTFIPINTNKYRPISVFYFLKMLKLLIQNPSYLKKIDVFYAQRMEYVLPFIFMKRSKKVAMAIHGSGKYAYLFWGNFIGTIYNFIEKLAIKRADRVVVLLNREEFGLPYYKNKFKDMSDKFSYGKVPLDLKRFIKMNKNESRKQVGLSEDDNVILYCGRIEDNPKRVLLFPQIAKKLKASIANLKWIVIGNGNDLEQLKEEVNKSGLDDIFLFKGHVSHGNELCSMINSADVSILLSNFEGICMSALESIACDTPVVATDVGDIKEYINDNSNGIVIDNSTEAEIVENATEALKKILEDRNIVKINDIVNKYESKVVYNETIEILKK